MSKNLFIFGRWGKNILEKIYIYYVSFAKSQVHFSACNEFHKEICNSEFVKFLVIQLSLTQYGMRHACNSIASTMNLKRWRTKRPLTVVKHFSCKINEHQANLTVLLWIAARIRAGTSKFWAMCVTNVEAPEIHQSVCIGIIEVILQRMLQRSNQKYSGARWIRFDKQKKFCQLATIISLDILYFVTGLTSAGGKW